MSLFLVTYHIVNGQTIESITYKRKLDVAGGPQINVGRNPRDIIINPERNKIYIANDLPSGTGTVSVIDSNSGTVKDIRVGVRPLSLAIDEDANKIYVANNGGNSVSVIDGYNDTKIKDIHVGGHPDHN